jgi:hypothetical protein
MIPPFDDNGYLPPGVYRATLDEIVARFGQESEMREAQAESLQWLVDLAKRAGVARVVLNGSFVTDVLEPNDVDCVLLIEAGFPTDAVAEAELVEGLPFLEIKLVRQEGFDEYVHEFFATDRHRVPKGMVEVIL